MAKTLLECIARALCERDNNPPDATMDGKALWRDYLPEARAVVETMREPTQDMINVANEYAEPGPAGIWRAMIDAALVEGE